MLCQDCGQRVATVVFTEVTAGRKKVSHLCRTCAEQRGLQAPDLNDPLASFARSREPLSPEDAPITPDPHDGLLCPDCSWTWARFRERGRLGCPGCYDAFREPLEGLLRQMHGAPEHLGKQARPVTRADRVDSPDELRRQLEQAVATEDFERAAQLRDRLRRSEEGRR